MTGSAHRTYTKLIKYALRITHYIIAIWPRHDRFSVDLRCIFGECFFGLVVQRSLSTLVQVACPWLLL